jgi:hypothetical protein
MKTIGRLTVMAAAGYALLLCMDRLLALLGVA